jgi:hypothetical protein
MGFIPQVSKPSDAAYVGGGAKIDHMTTLGIADIVPSQLQNVLFHHGGNSSGIYIPLFTPR